jgi:hypothetical protein
VSRTPTKAHSPVAVGLVVDRTRDNLERFYDLYEKAHPYAHDAKDKPTDDQRLRVSSSSVADSTPSIVADQMFARRRLGQVAARIQDVDTKVQKTLEMLEEVFKEPFNCATCGLTYNPKCKDGTEHEEDLEPLAAYKEPDQQQTTALTEAEDAREKRRIGEELQRIEIRAESLRRRQARLG